MRAYSTARQYEDLQLISANCGGAPGVWRVIRDLVEQESAHPEARRADVLLLQEASLSDDEARAVCRALDGLGFRTYYTPGASTRDRWGRPQRRGGLLCAARRVFPAALLCQISGTPLQIQVCKVAHWTLLNYYVPPRADIVQGAMESLQQVFLEEHIGAGGRPWMLAGDANLDTQDSALVDKVSMLGGQLVPGVRAQSSRWNSSSKIDFLFTNHLSSAGSALSLPEKVSDHKALAVRLKYTREVAGNAPVDPKDHDHVSKALRHTQMLHQATNKLGTNVVKRQAVVKGPKAPAIVDRLKDLRRSPVDVRTFTPAKRIIWHPRTHPLSSASTLQPSRSVNPPEGRDHRDRPRVFCGSRRIM